MDIILNNRTLWSEAHLKTFITKVARIERPELCKHRAQAMTVSVSRAKGSSKQHSGTAQLKKNCISIKLPDEEASIDKVDFAQLLSRLLAITRGMTQKAMRGNSQYCARGSYRDIYAWANDLPLATNGRRYVTRASSRQVAKPQQLATPPPPRKVGISPAASPLCAVVQIDKWSALQKIRHHDGELNLRTATKLARTATGNGTDDTLLESPICPQRNQTCVIGSVQQPS